MLYHLLVSDLIFLCKLCIYFSEHCVFVAFISEPVSLATDEYKGTVMFKNNEAVVLMLTFAKQCTSVTLIFVQLLQAAKVKKTKKKNTRVSQALTILRW